MTARTVEIALMLNPDHSLPPAVYGQRQRLDIVHRLHQRRHEVLTALGFDDVDLLPNIVFRGIGPLPVRSGI